jgi:CBS domain-containing protein
MNFKVHDYMNKKPIFCAVGEKIKYASKLMYKNNCGALPIINSERSKKVTGLITDRDISCRSLGRGLNPLELMVEDCMSSPAITVYEHDNLEKVFQLMLENRLSRLPVVNDDNQLLGMLSISDLLRSQDFEKFRDKIEAILRVSHLA